MQTEMLRNTLCILNTVQTVRTPCHADIASTAGQHSCCSVAATTMDPVGLGCKLNKPRNGPHLLRLHARFTPTDGQPERRQLVLPILLAQLHESVQQGAQTRAYLRRQRLLRAECNAKKLNAQPACTAMTYGPKCHEPWPMISHQAQRVR